MFLMCMLLLGVCASAALQEASILMDTSLPVHTTHPWFLSLGMDSNLIRRRWESFDFASKKISTLAKGLSPAYLRLMGTDGDRMVFEDTPFKGSCESKEDCPMQPLWQPGHWDSHYKSTFFTMYSDDWDDINEFASSVGWRLLFGFNLQLRTDDGKWDSSNAIKLLKYTIQKGYAFNMDFQLGNEPDIYPLFNFTAIPGQQLAKDVKKLRNLLDTEFGTYYKNAILTGPDLAMGQSTEYLSQFLLDIDDEINAVTFHQYYGGSEINHLDNFTDPKILDTYIPIVDGMIRAVKNSHHPNMAVWQGETSSSYAPPGDSTICESYAAGFMLLVKLGLSAARGLDLVVRQTFYGFWFALIGQDLQPKPNYWTALLFKKLVGNRVLGVDVKMVGNKPQRVRAYAHCAKDDGIPGTEPGALVVYVMNLFNKDVSVTFKGELNGSDVDEYLLTPNDDNPLSQGIKLNGVLIKMSDDETLPELKPRKVTTQQIKIPGLSYAYYVFLNAKAKACL